MARGVNPKHFLRGYKGFLHCDGYAGYHNFPKDVIISGCFAHARRKFDEALKPIPKNQQIGRILGYRTAQEIYQAA